MHVRVDEVRQKHSALCFESFFCGFRTEPVDEAVFNKYCLRIERSREDVEHAGVENGKVMDLRKLFKTPIFERWGKQFCLN